MKKINTKTPETDALLKELEKNDKHIYNIAEDNLKKKRIPINLEKIIGSGGVGVVAKGYISNHFLDRKNIKNLVCAVKIIRPEKIYGINKDANYANRQRFKKEVSSSDKVYTNLKNLGEGLEKHMVRTYDDGEFEYDKDESLNIKRGMIVRTIKKVVNLLDIGLENNISWRYMISEYVEGKDLSEYVRKLSPKEVVQIGKIVCRVLEETHRQNFLHRDIKLTNILIPNEKIQKLKVVDFGLAKRTDSGVPIYGSIVGSIGFAAPEQIDYKSQFLVDERSDIFGLGAVIYSLLSGELVYGEKEVKLLHGRGHIPIPKPRHLIYFGYEKILSDVIMKSVSPNKRYRYSNASEFKEALEYVYKKL